MNKLIIKLVFVVMIFVTLIGILTTESSALTEYKLGNFATANVSGYLYRAISFQFVIYSNNLYCVEQYQSWPRVSNHLLKVSSRVDFSGDTVTFHDYQKGVYNKKTRYI